MSANAPGRVASLVLAATSAKLGTPELWAERAETALTRGVEALADGTMERWFSPTFHMEHPGIVARYRAMVAETPPDGYAGCCGALGEWDFRERLGEIGAPTLVVVGEDDPATTPEHAELIASSIPNAELEVFPEVRHLLNVEMPDDFNRTILEHLRA